MPRQVARVPPRMKCLESVLNSSMYLCLVCVCERRHYYKIEIFYCIICLLSKLLIQCNFIEFTNIFIHPAFEFDIIHRYRFLYLYCIIFYWYKSHFVVINLLLFTSILYIISSSLFDHLLMVLRRW